MKEYKIVVFFKGSGEGNLLTLNESQFDLLKYLCREEYFDDNFDYVYIYDTPNI